MGTTLLQLGSRDSLEYNFTTTFVWRNIYGFKIARMDDYFLLRANAKDTSYLFPTGRGPLEPVIRALAADAGEVGVPLRFNTVLPAAKAWLTETYPGKFDFTLSRDGADYVYETQSLATLTGKKLASKRNHIHRFLDNNPDWQYEPFSAANLGEVRKMATEWIMVTGCAPDAGLSDEYCAVESAIRHYDELVFPAG